MADKITKPFLLDETGKLMAEHLATIADAMMEMSTGKLNTWAQVLRAVRRGRIADYLSAGDQLEVKSSYMVTAATDGSGITGATVTAYTFISATSSKAGIYSFNYDGAAWSLNGNTVSLAEYGVVVTGTPADGDSVVITVTANENDYSVLGIDEDEPVDSAYGHCLSFKMDKILSSINFDPPQYLYAVTADQWPSGMPAGTYNITLDHGAYGGDTSEDGTYSFTTTKTIPVGGGIRHTSIGGYLSSGYGISHVTGGKFITYAADTVTELESNLATSGGASGTNLGTATASNPAYKKGDYINFTQRQMYGSNRWLTSYIRQLLNSDDAMLDWKPATIWSRNTTAKPEGFLHSLDTDLRAALCKVRQRYALCVADGYGYEDVEDYVTLDTMLDIFGSQNNGIAEGPVDDAGNVTRTTAYSYWKENNTDADRIKVNSAGTPAIYWMGSVRPSNGGNGRHVTAAGALNFNNAYNAYGVVPSLHIG